ncbi:MAG: TonB-dependent receptor [Cyanothece sp. SIO1E1]|nr:TonB-dependent receptor [Cyanothece sp. SIO1E1]
MRFWTSTLVCLFFTQWISAQSTATISGTVKDENNAPIEFVTVYLDSTSVATETAQNGRYSLSIPADKPLVLVFSRIGYKEARTNISPMPARSSRQVDVTLVSSSSDIEVVVKESKIQDAGIIREGVEQIKLLPSTTGNLESALPHIALGTSGGTGGELSSQYNVRGGNYDENLVYVNDFEIYRPQLIRAGQQEGLTFPNIDLIRDLSFSSGGFASKYGDKLSSVLDVKYKRPDSLRASLSMSFLGGSAHVEGSTSLGSDSYRKLRYLVGARYKTTQYLLGTLDVNGEYTTDFSDIQAYVTYDLSRDLQLGVMGNINRSVYQLVPRTRSTAQGLISFALELFSVFEGQEVDDFTTQMGGVSLTYIPDRDRNPYYLKLLASRFQSDENERIDIIGDYSLRQIESDLGSSNFGEVLAELGTGTQHQYIRNFLDIRLTNVEHKGGIELQLDPDDPEVTSSHFIQYGAKFQREEIDDWINEWERLDSAGYSLPYNDDAVEVFTVLKTRNRLNSNRFNGYLQETFTWRKESVAEMQFTAGVRASYWDLNKEFIFAPRGQFLYKPLGGDGDVSYRLAGGLYFQPPFYREMRGFDGIVNTDLRSQKSAHVVAGMTYDFYMGKRNPKKFRFIAEAYYKSLWDMVPYEVENVRIRYYANNDGRGYVTGIDFRLNGEFVPDAESWINLSFLRARERLNGVDHRGFVRNTRESVEVEDVSRPTDQFMTMSMFFQDYLRKNKNVKMHLNFTLGTGLPFGIPNNNIDLRNPYRYTAYHRVDIGFSVLLWDQERRNRRPNHWLNFTRNTWLSLEIFNLMQVQNQAGNTWIKTILEQQYAIPNFLTTRRINLRLRMDF